MMERTDRHCRYFMRLISRQVVLYSEMVTTSALLHGNHEDLLKHDPGENPVVLQLGGNEPSELAICSAMGEDSGYDEINLNIGCPSTRVQSGRIGACLMAEPTLVAECVSAMSAAVSVPVTVKTRIGIDDQDSYDSLCNFVEVVSSGGCGHFIIHARKAVLKGLSPRENRTIPPLRYDYVHRIKRDFPGLRISINGGLKTPDQIRAQLQHVDAVMIGREAYDNPYLLAEIQGISAADDEQPVSREEIIRKLGAYIAREQRSGVKPAYILRHVYGLYKGRPGARIWRRELGNALRADQDIGVLMDALSKHEGRVQGGIAR